VLAEIGRLGGGKGVGHGEKESPQEARPGAKENPVERKAACANSPATSPTHARLQASESDFPQQTLDGQLMMRRHAFKNAGKRASLDRFMIWDNLMMLATALSRYANVRTILPGYLLAERA
jgi:hypothetical protein